MVGMAIMQDQVDDIRREKHHIANLFFKFARGSKQLAGKYMRALWVGLTSVSCNLASRIDSRASMMTHITSIARFSDEECLQMNLKNYVLGIYMIRKNMVDEDGGMRLCEQLPTRHPRNPALPYTSTQRLFYPTELATEYRHRLSCPSSIFAISAQYDRRSCPQVLVRLTDVAIKFPFCASLLVSSCGSSTSTDSHTT